MSIVLPTPYNPVPDFGRYILNTCSADAQLVAAIAKRKNGKPGIYDSAAPEDAAYPFVRYAILTAPMITGAGAIRIANRPLVLIDVIGETAARGDLEAAANRIDALFGQGRGNVQSGQLLVQGSWCEDFVSPPPTVSNGIEYRRLGGKYRFFCSFVPAP